MQLRIVVCIKILTGLRFLLRYVGYRQIAKFITLFQKYIGGTSIAKEKQSEQESSPYK